MPLASTELRRALLLLVAIVLAVCGQLFLLGGGSLIEAVAVLAVAAATFLGGAGLAPISRDARATPLPARPLVTSSALRLLSVAVALVLAVVAFVYFDGNRFSRVGILCWVGSLAAFVVAAADRPERRVADATANGGLTAVELRQRKLARALALCAVVLVGAFFRLYRLDEVPAEMISDHAEKLLDVRDVLDGRFSIFFPRNGGREPLEFYLAAGLHSVASLPLSFSLLKLVSALGGIVAIPLTYVLGRELWNARVGILAAALLAMSHWHVVITRGGLRQGFASVFAVATLYYLVRAFRDGRRNDWLGAGVALGVGLLAYQAMRIVPLVVITLALITLCADALVSFRGGKAPHSSAASSLTRRFWVNGLLAAVAALLVFLPLLRFMTEQPDLFWHRAMTRIADWEKPLAAPLWSQLATNLWNALTMFNYRADATWYNSLPDTPALDWMTGALFVLGAVYILAQILRLGDRRSLYVLVALVGMLLPSVLSVAFPGENPSFSRTIGAAPLAAIVAALPLAITVSHLRSLGGKVGSIVAVLVLGIVLSTTAVLNYAWYFHNFDAHCRRASWNSSEMATVLREFVAGGGNLVHAYHVGYPHWVDTRAIAINVGDMSWSNGLTDVRVASGHVHDPAAKLYLLHPADLQSLTFLQSLYPQAKTTQYQSKTPGKNFTMLLVPRDDGNPGG